MAAWYFLVGCTRKITFLYPFAIALSLNSLKWNPRKSNPVLMDVILGFSSLSTRQRSAKNCSTTGLISSHNVCSLGPITKKSSAYRTNVPPLLAFRMMLSSPSSAMFAM